MKRWYLAAALVLALSAGPAGAAPFGAFTVGTLARAPLPIDDGSTLAFASLDQRLGPTFFDFRPENEIRRGGYDLDLELLTLPVLLDWRPFEDSFHISTGLILNATQASLDARATGLPTAGAAAWSASGPGTVHGEMQFNPLVPYLGFGWTRTFGKKQRWGFTSDFGVAFLGTPRVSLEPAGPLASDPAYRRALAQEEQDIEDDLSDFRIYPIVSVSFFYRF